MLENIKKRLKQVGIFAVVLIVLALVFAPSKEEAKTQKLEKIKTLEIKAQKSIEPYDSMIFYKELLELDPKNNNYKQNFENFKKLDSYMKNCRIKSRTIDQNSLKFPSSYSEIVRAGKFTSDNIIILSASFTGENILKQKNSFKSIYKCTILNNNISIARTEFNKVD